MCWEVCVFGGCVYEMSTRVFGGCVYGMSTRVLGLVCVGRVCVCME